MTKNEKIYLSKIFAYNPEREKISQRFQKVQKLEILHYFKMDSFKKYLLKNGKGQKTKIRKFWQNFEKLKKLKFPKFLKSGQFYKIKSNE